MSETQTVAETFLAQGKIKRTCLSCKRSYYALQDRKDCPGCGATYGHRPPTGMADVVARKKATATRIQFHQVKKEWRTLTPGDWVLHHHGREGSVWYVARRCDCPSCKTWLLFAGSKPETLKFVASFDRLRERDEATPATASRAMKRGKGRMAYKDTLLQDSIGNRPSVQGFIESIC